MHHNLLIFRHLYIESPATPSPRQVLPGRFVSTCRSVTGDSSGDGQSVNSGQEIFAAGHYFAGPIAS
jgi:hypothetical protein